MQTSTKNTKRLLVGEINGLFGIKGWVKIFSHTDPRDKIVSFGKLLIKNGDDFNEIKITGKKQGKTIIAKIDSVNNTQQAEKYLGVEVYIDTSWLEKLGDEYYYYQLEGLRVKGVDGFDFGKVEYLFDTGSNTVIATKTDKEHLIPYIEPFLISVDLAKQEIIVDWDKDF